MSDLYFTEEGDIVPGPNGDLAVTPTVWRDDVQAAYIRVMTDIGDFLIYPQLGADLSRLYGEPQSPRTGDTGINLIYSALEREGRFVGRTYTVGAVPTSLQSIRFDINMKSPAQGLIKLSVMQKLGV